MQVPCTIDDTEIESDESDRMIDGVIATCSECGHTTESYGTSERSIQRCLALMREECPEGENNFYVEE